MAHGGARKPARGYYLHRDAPRRTSTLNDERAPAGLVFMAHDRIERTLAHDTDAYRVRRMLDARDLWTVVPEWDIHASTAFEREFFDDIGIMGMTDARYRLRIAARRKQLQSVRAKRTAKMQRVLGVD